MHTSVVPFHFECASSEIGHNVHVMQITLSQCHGVVLLVNDGRARLKFPQFHPEEHMYNRHLLADRNHADQNAAAAADFDAEEVVIVH